MRFYLAVSLAFFGTVCWSDSVVPSATLRANTIIAPGHLTMIERDVPGAAESIEELIGLETKVTLYAGRPVFPQDVGPPAVVLPNQLVTLIYQTGGLRIEVDGRALGRGGAGDRIRIMNLSSRSTLFGEVQPSGIVLVKD